MLNHFIQRRSHLRPVIIARLHSFIHRCNAQYWRSIKNS